MNSKKFVITAISSLLVIALAIGGALAYLGSSDKKTNTVIVGHGKETVSEVFSSPERQNAPGDNIQKTVSVVNEGDTPCFARLYVDFSDSEMRDKVNVRMTQDGTPYTWVGFKNALKENVHVTSPNPDWIFVEDETALRGYFYYTKALTPDNNGKATSPLFNYIESEYNRNESFYAESTKDDYISDYNIIVYSETVQTIGTGGTDYGATNDWRTAWEKFLRVSP